MTEFTKKLQYIEEKYNLTSVNVDGYSLWVYMRHLMLSTSSSVAVGTPVSSSFVEIVRHVVPKTVDVFRMLFRKCKPSKADILFLLSGRRYLIDGLYECYMTDDLADLYPNSLTLEYSYNFKHFSPAKTKNMVFADKFLLGDFIVSIIKKIFNTRRYKAIYKRTEDILFEPLSELLGHSDERIKEWINWSTFHFFLHNSHIKKVERFIRSVSPKLIIVTNFSFYNMIANEVAKRLGIPSVELVHGMFPRGNFTYNFPCSSSIPQYPDYIFSFSDFDKRGFTSPPISKNRIIPVGYPYFEKSAKKFKNMVKENEDDCIVVFLSTPDKTVTGEFERLAIDTHDCLAEKGWKVVYKLHPFEYGNWKELYPLLAASTVDVVDTPQRNLYEIFAMSSALVGITSTAILEGIGFGLAAFIYDNPISVVMDDLVESGLAKKVIDSKDLCLELDDLDLSYDGSKCAAELFKPNALENMKSEIDKIISN
ncbi:MAG: hypothetical protein FWC75_02400 [Oscillospiraceae bacterium]|nr:hypothetical protein [Oscillospiraceae bacterium]